jgi:hypothetical protein
MEKNITLDVLGLKWLEFIDLVGSISLAVGAIVGGIGYFVVSKNFIWLFVFCLFMAIVFNLSHQSIFYALVKCPNCKSKLNYFKNGNKVPNEQAWGDLRRGKACRHCGWQPIANTNA